MKHKVLAVIGSILVLAPLVFMVTITLIFWLSTGELRMDFMIPAEVFPVPLVGGVILVLINRKKKTKLRIIPVCLAGMILGLALSQIIAVVTGLADGRLQTMGWQFYLVIGLLILYDLLVLGLAVGGIRLVQKLFK